MQIHKILKNGKPQYLENVFSCSNTIDMQTLKILKHGKLNILEMYSLTVIT